MWGDCRIKINANITEIYLKPLLIFILFQQCRTVKESASVLDCANCGNKREKYPLKICIADLACTLVNKKYTWTSVKISHIQELIRFMHPYVWTARINGHKLNPAEQHCTDCYNFDAYYLYYLCIHLLM